MWITNQLPDDNITVLVRLDYGVMPIWPCFRVAGRWYSDDGLVVISDVTRWMHLDDAAALLDRKDT